MLPDNSSSTHNLTLITIINADGIYLATYSALLLNLKLIKQGYYQEQHTKPVPMTEVGVNWITWFSYRLLPLIGVQCIIWTLTTNWLNHFTVTVLLNSCPWCVRIFYWQAMVITLYDRWHTPALCLCLRLKCLLCWIGVFVGILTFCGW